MQTTRQKILFAIITTLALIGAADSGYALYQHYAPANTSSCDISETVSCTAVNQSDESVLFGVPVAAIGIAGYVFLGLLGTGMLWGRLSQRIALPLLLIAAIGALAFAVRLTYIELFMLKAVCPLCVISQMLIAAISLLAALAFFGRSQTNRAPVS